MRLIDTDTFDCLTWNDGEHGTTFDDGVLWILEKIDKLPTIEPEQRWIPCSERLPNKSGEYLITGVEISPGVYQSFYYKSENAWSHWNLIVTAWMPLPEPYMAERRK